MLNNIDRLEETLSGEGTSLRVNAIAVSSTTHGIAADLPLDHMWKCLIQRSRLLRRNRTCCGFLFTFNNRTVSGWTGFNIIVRIEVEVSKDNIGYLPTIDAPATNMSTVFEVLSQSLKIKDSLKLNSI